MRSFRRSDQAQAMVEFALVLPIILLLLFGMLQLALVLNARQTVAYAAQAAANGYALTLIRAQGDARAIEAGAQIAPRFATAGSVRYSLVRGTDESNITADGTGTFGDLVVARATYRYPSPIRAGIGGFRFPDTIDLSVEAVARIEAPATASTAASGTVLTATPPPPTPTPTPTAPPTAAYTICFAFVGATPNVPGATGTVLVDGAPPASRTFVGESEHRVSVQYAYRSGWQTSYAWADGRFFMPWSGTTGVQSTSIAPVRAGGGSFGSVVMTFKGVPGPCN